MKRIEVIVSPKGESQIETYGFTGDSCRAATKQLEAALGARQNETLKPEFHEPQSINIQQSENG
jgi:hypothetical protein